MEWWPLYPAGVERWPLYPAVGEGGAAGVECLERWPLYVFLGSATVCLGCSTVYHLFGTANEKWEIALRFARTQALTLAPTLTLTLSLTLTLTLALTLTLTLTLALALTRNVDYGGIVSLIVGSCAPVVHFGFGDAYPLTRLVYMLAIGAPAP